MSQFYFDPARATDPHALPDGEVFYFARLPMRQEWCEECR